MRILFDVSSLFRDGRVESGVPSYTLSLIDIFQKISSQTEERLPRSRHRILRDPASRRDNDRLEVMFFYSGRKSFGLEQYIKEYIHLPIPNKIIQLLTFLGVRFDWLVGRFGRWRVGGSGDDNFLRAKLARKTSLKQLSSKIASPLSSQGDGAVFDIYFTPNVSTFYRYFSNKIKVVGVVHDISQILLPEMKACGERWKYLGQSKTHIVEKLAFWNRNRRPIFERFDRLVAISWHTKNDFVEFLKIPEEKISVMYPSLHNQSPILRFARIVELIQKPYLLFLGHIEPRKNVENLIRAFSILKRDKNDLRFVVAGRMGYQSDKLLRLAKELGLTFSVIANEAWRSRSDARNEIVSQSLAMTDCFDIIFTGPVSEEEKYVLMKNAEVFVYPSLYEGFAYPCLEAMSVGTPVVTSPVSALPEVLGDAALYANPWRPEAIAKVVEEVLQDQNLRDDLVQKGKKQIEKFQNSEIQARQWEELFKKFQ